MCEDGQSKWTVLTKDVFSTGFAVKSVKEGKAYKFRVSCINEKGSSKPSKVSDPITAAESTGELVSLFCVCLSTCLFVCWGVCLVVCLFVCLVVYCIVGIFQEFLLDKS